MIVYVSQEHIDKGICGDSHKCAVAKAVLDAAVDDMHKWFGDEETAPKQIKVSVDGTNIHVNGLTFKTPKKVSNFIGRFDDDPKSVKPFEFKLTRLAA